jgi:CubicO group peptidase (beta-lactamase class C family)
MRHTFLEGHDPETPGLLDSQRHCGWRYAILRTAHLKRQRRLRGWNEARADHLVDLSANHRYYNGWSWAAGGLNASLGDLATFFAALRRHELLSEESEAMVRAHSTVRSEGPEAIDMFSYGGGWDGVSSLCEELGGDMVVVVRSRPGRVMSRMTPRHSVRANRRR